MQVYGIDINIVDYQFFSISPLFDKQESCRVAIYSVTATASVSVQHSICRWNEKHIAKADIKYNKKVQLFYLHSLKTSWHNNLNCVFSALIQKPETSLIMAAYQYILLYSVGGGGRGVRLSLVWISKAVVSRIEDETMLLSVFY